MTNIESPLSWVSSTFRLQAEFTSAKGRCFFFWHDLNWLYRSSIRGISLVQMKTFSVFTPFVVPRGWAGGWGVSTLCILHSPKPKPHLSKCMEGIERIWRGPFFFAVVFVGSPPLQLSPRHFFYPGRRGQGTGCRPPPPCSPCSEVR